MGTLLLPNEPGNDCLVCWGIGKDFGDGPTPHVIQMRLTSTLPGEFSDEANFDNLLVTHYLEQKVPPCSYEIIDGDIAWRLFWNFGQSFVEIRSIVTARFVFFAQPFDECALDFTNVFQTAPGRIAYGGFVNITWDLEGLQ